MSMFTTVILKMVIVKTNMSHWQIASDFNLNKLHGEENSRTQMMQGHILINSPRQLKKIQVMITPKVKIHIILISGTKFLNYQPDNIRCKMERLFVNSKIMNPKRLNLVCFILFFSYIFLSCSREQKYESAIATQLLPSIIDSLSHDHICDRNNINYYVFDTLVKPLDSYKLNYSILNTHGIKIPGLQLIEKEKCKLDLPNKEFINKNQITIINDFLYFDNLQRDDSICNILLVFSRVSLNNDQNQGFFILLVYENRHSANEFILYILKTKKQWGIKQKILSGVVWEIPAKWHFKCRLEHSGISNSARKKKEWKKVMCFASDKLNAVSWRWCSPLCSTTRRENW